MKKTVYLIGGTMGVGKTAVCQVLKRRLENAVFLDGDWCWDADPFIVTDETKAMVMQNIVFLLHQFIHCSAYDNIILGWVMHEQSIIDTLLQSLDREDVTTKPISLICTEQTLRARLQKDIDAGVRTLDIIDRSVARIPLYTKLDTMKIITDGKTPDAIAGEIKAL